MVPHKHAGISMHVRHETIAAKENHRQMQLLISTKQKTKYESMRRKNAIVKKQKKNKLNV